VPNELPPNLTLWRFGQVFCAKDRDRQVVLSWHRCRWRSLGPAAKSEEPATEPGWLAEEPAPSMPREPEGWDHLWVTRVEGNLWSRVLVRSDAATGWLVGGQIPPAELLRVAKSLPVHNHPMRDPAESAAVCGRGRARLPSR
jgi:hypothetical protein